MINILMTRSFSCLLLTAVSLVSFLNLPSRSALMHIPYITAMIIKGITQPRHVQTIKYTLYPSSDIPKFLRHVKGNLIQAASTHEHTTATNFLVIVILFQWSILLMALRKNTQSCYTILVTFTIKSTSLLGSLQLWLNESNVGYSEVPPLRNSLHKDSLIGFLCQDILLQNRVCIPWYKKHFYTPNSCRHC